MKGIVLYSSKYGATKKYAMWLSEAAGFICRDVKSADIREVEQYDAIVFGGGIYASGIAGISFLKKHGARLKDKRVLVFCVGASPYEQEALEEIRKRNLPGALGELPLFYCRGIWNKENMTFRDRALCTMLQKAVAKKAPEDLAIWEKALVEAGSSPRDWTDRAYLTPILDSLK